MSSSNFTVRSSNSVLFDLSFYTARIDVLSIVMIPPSFHFGGSVWAFASTYRGLFEVCLFDAHEHEHRVFLKTLVVLFCLKLTSSAFQWTAVRALSGLGVGVICPRCGLWMDLHGFAHSWAWAKP